MKILKCVVHDMEHRIGKNPEILQGSDKDTTPELELAQFYMIKKFADETVRDLKLLSQFKSAKVVEVEIKEKGGA